MDPLSTPAASEPSSSKSELSEREREILRLVATGASNKEIAQQLVISPNTVKVHLRNIFGKIGAVSRTEATVYAIRQGWVQVESQPSAQSQTLFNESSSSKPSGGDENFPLIPQPRGRTSVVLGMVVVFVALLIPFIWATALTQSRSPIPATSTPTVVPTPRWQPKTVLPQARTGAGAVSYENFIYVIGGESEQGIIGHLDRYNPNIDQWEALASKSVATTDIGAGVIGGQIYVPGGRLPSGQITTTLEVYDPHTDLWTQRTPLPTPLSAYALVTFEGRLYLFGGWDGEDYVDSTYQYDPVLDEWTELTPMPTARGFAGAAVAGGKIYVIGGTNGIQWLTNNEAYSPELDTIDISPSHPWQTRSALPTPRAYMGISALADLIYLVGGEQTPTQDPALEYVATQDTWQGFEPPGFEASWIGLELVTVGSKLYALGGKIDGIPVNYVLDYQAIFTIVFPIIQK